MKYETIVSVDEATKKFMGYINEEISANISEGINAALRRTNSDLEEVSKKANTILLSLKSNSKTIDYIPSAIEESQKKTEQIIANEFLKTQQAYEDIDEAANTAFLKEQKMILEEIRKLNNANSKNQDDILIKILAVEDKLNIANSAIEAQTHMLERLEKIEEEINYLKLPFYKRLFYKGKEV